MTLVEGHGDYVMDAVGPQVVPSVAEIRARFNARRGTAGRLEQTLRRILGIDLKMKQYAQGSRFVQAVVEEAGMAIFNKVWTSPETLPTKEEFATPALWLDRVGRGGALAAGWLTGRWAPHPAVAQARVGVRRCLGDLAAGRLVLAACSGGSDSLALAAALAHRGAAARAARRWRDHRSWTAAGSADRAGRVQAVLAGLGLDPVHRIAVTVAAQPGHGGPEAAARTARYAALEQAAQRVRRGGRAARPHPG